MILLVLSVFLEEIVKLMQSFLLVIIVVVMIVSVFFNEQYTQHREVLLLRFGVLAKVLQELLSQVLLA